MPPISQTGTVTELIKVQIAHIKAFIQLLEALADPRVPNYGGCDDTMHSRAQLLYRESKKLHWVAVF
jgi:hypothetical protein